MSGPSTNPPSREIRLFKPSIGDEELAAVKEVFERAWLGPGPKVAEFERAWSDYLGVAESVAVNSGTAALQLGLGSLELPRGSKVLIPALTFVSTAFSVLANDLIPVFVDIDEETLCIDVGDLVAKATAMPDCAAVIVVHFGGHAADMEPVMNAARELGLKVVEDCAHCPGGSHPTLGKLGTIGDVGCFSFEEKKGMTTGDGGMVSARDSALLSALPARRWLGIDKDTWKRRAGYTQADGSQDDPNHWRYEIAEFGWKFTMNDIAAAIGLVQLAKLDRMNERRRRAIARYLAGIEGVAGIRPLLPYALEGSSYWLFGVRVADRDSFVLHMKAAGIATGVHYMPLPLHPFFADHQESVSKAIEVWEGLVTLPLFADITDDEVDDVLAAIRRYRAP